MYEIERNPAKAIELVKKVVELNPENKAAKDRLANLQAGKVTVILPEPIQGDAAKVEDEEQDTEKSAKSEEEKAADKSE
jgi:hypothetical protein